MAIECSLDVRLNGEDNVQVEIGRPVQMGFLAMLAAVNPKAAIRSGDSMSLQEKTNFLWGMPKPAWTSFSADEIDMLLDSVSTVFDPKHAKELPFPVHFEPAHAAFLLQPMVETLETASRLLATPHGQE